MIGRYRGQDDLEETRRKQAIENIRKSIDNGIAEVAWDIDIPEWGLITGYVGSCNFENVEILNSKIKGLKINGFEIEKLIEKELSKQ